MLRTKLYRPRVGHQIVQRAALRQRIEGGIGGDLTLVTAPAGYGKTTAVADWAAHTGSRVAWVTLDEYDNDIISFLSYTVASVVSDVVRGCSGAASATDQAPLRSKKSAAVSWYFEYAAVCTRNRSSG